MRIVVSLAFFTHTAPVRRVPARAFTAQGQEVDGTGWTMDVPPERFVRQPVKLFQLADAQCPLAHAALSR
ncbi:MAG TPA: hypothetical protein VF514_15360 [Bacteroidota bacterium]